MNAQNDIYKVKYDSIFGSGFDTNCNNLDKYYYQASKKRYSKKKIQEDTVIFKMLNTLSERFQNGDSLHQIVGSTYCGYKFELRRNGHYELGLSGGYLTYEVFLDTNWLSIQIHYINSGTNDKRFEVLCMYRDGVRDYMNPYYFLVYMFPVAPNISKYKKHEFRAELYLLDMHRKNGK